MQYDNSQLLRQNDHSFVLIVGDKAIKHVKQTNLIGFYKEIFFVSLCKHDNIIQFNNFRFDTSLQIGVIVMELYQCTLATYVNKVEMQKINYAAFYAGYMQDICSAVRYIHKIGFSHLDIKPQNILLGEKGAVLCDFGSACFTTKNISDTRLQTLMFRAPEVCLDGPPINVLTSALDIWSIGTLIGSVANNSNNLFNVDLNLGVYGDPLNHIAKKFGIRATRKISSLEVRNNLYAKLLQNKFCGKLKSGGRNYESLVIECLHPDPARRPNINKVYAEICQIVNLFIMQGETVDTTFGDKDRLGRFKFQSAKTLRDIDAKIEAIGDIGEYLYPTIMRSNAANADETFSMIKDLISLC